MDIEVLKDLIAKGEGHTTKFKKSTTDITKDVYETECAFSNQDGGYIFLDKVFPGWGMDLLRTDLIERARKMTIVRSSNHPWRSMDDEELLRSAGLILLDSEKQK